eukprot:jgi/Phyca11/533232/estExt2_fgenesh1_pg.C_PHYCAscaffold_110133
MTPELLSLQSYDTFDLSISKRQSSPHPQDAASWLSRLLLDWVRPLMSLGQQKQLDGDDVWPLRWDLQANTVSFRFSSVYEASQSMYKATIIVIVSYMLYDVLGMAALAGVSVIVAMLGVNHLISKCMFACQRVYRRSKDVRMKKVTEVFKAVEIVKFNAWEDRLMGQIKDTRAVEMKHLFDDVCLLA